MKKILSFTLAIVMCLSLCACGGNGGTAQSEDTTEEIDKNSTETYVGAWAYDTGIRKPPTPAKSSTTRI